MGHKKIGNIIKLLEAVYFYKSCKQIPQAKCNNLIFSSLLNKTKLCIIKVWPYNISNGVTTENRSRKTRLSQLISKGQVRAILQNYFFPLIMCSILYSNTIWDSKSSTYVTAALPDFESQLKTINEDWESVANSPLLK